MSISSLFQTNGYDLKAEGLVCKTLVATTFTADSIDVGGVVLDPTPEANDAATSVLAVNPLGSTYPLVTMNVAEGEVAATLTFLTYPTTLPAPITSCKINYIRVGGSCQCSAAIFPFPATSGAFTASLSLPPGLSRGTAFTSDPGELIGTATSTDNANTSELLIQGLTGATNLAKLVGTVAYVSPQVISVTFSYNGIP